MLPSKGVLSQDTDLNNLKTSGIYVTRPGVSNLPSGGDGWGVVVVLHPHPNGSTINCTQLYLGSKTMSRWTASAQDTWYGWV